MSPILLRPHSLLWLLALTASCALAGSDRPTEPQRLWPEQAPVEPDREHIHNDRIVEVDNPTLTPFWPEQVNGAAVVVFPGGAYQWLAFDKEGVKAARWLNQLGVAVFVAKYRLDEYGHPAPLLDGLRAVRYLRDQARDWGLDPERIGVLGFSAGGHLAGSVALHSNFEHPGLDPDPLGHISARPDFAMLVYPVATMQDDHTHKGSREALLGSDEHLDPETLRRHSLESLVGPEMPPLFLVHGSGDQAVPPANSLQLYEAAMTHRPESELHIFQTDQHGFGLESGAGTASAWPVAAESWLRLNGILESAQ